MIVLGIETSCDETGIALYDSHKGIIADKLYSQIAMHAAYGGVVPELASRDHLQKTLPLIDELLQTSGQSKEQLDAIVYTRGPGLLGALMVGSSLAKSLALGLGIPSLGVHHLEGHLLVPMLEHKEIQFPFLALIVSGGHTLLIKAHRLGDYQILGETLDDAVGEAFDKVSTMLGLGYPGGPQVAKLATESSACRFNFPKPMTNKPNLDFSFSGLKTFTANTIARCLTKKLTASGKLSKTDRKDIAKAFEDAVVETLVIKCRRALKQTGLTQLVIAGGVSANQKLRTHLATMVNALNTKLYYAQPNLCTDNGVMIAYTGYLRLQAGETEDYQIDPLPRWSIQTLKIS